MTMYRPIHFLDNNTYSFILMRNRSEELMEIPVQYVKSINFSMGQYVNEPIEVSIEIPSIIDRHGEKVELPLFKMIKGKMQILMEINDKKYMLDITDINENENKKMSGMDSRSDDSFHDNTADLYGRYGKGSSIALSDIF